MLALYPWVYAPEVGQAIKDDIVDPYVPEELQHFAVSSLINVAARNPYVFVATLIGHGAWHLYDHYRGEVKVNREIGALSTPTPTSTTTASKRSESGRTSSAAGNSAHGFRKRKGVSARGKCPKGHYWSYKQKKCLKSKF